MRIQTLQSLRLVFVLLIFLSHFRYGGRGSLYGGGDCGVCFFLILSGFVLSLGYGQRLREKTFSYGKFYFRRLRKVYPLHLVCFLLFLLLQWNSLSADSIKPLLANVLLVQSWRSNPDYFFSGNSVSWFLSDLLFLYLVFPFVFRFIYWLRLRSVVIVMSLLIGFYAFVAGNMPSDSVLPDLYIYPPTRLLDFAIGISLSRFFLLLQERLGKNVSVGNKRFVRNSILECLLIAGLVFLFVIDPTIDEQWGTAVLFWTWLPVIILSFGLMETAGQGGGFVSQWLLHPLLLKWGALSFEFYMVHQLVIRGVLLLLMKLQVQPPYLVVLTVCLMLSALLAGLLHRLLRPVTAS